jgi:exodeoxyribonuclease-3
MIVATWNVNSISVRLPQVIEWLKSRKPDILCLQETKTIDDKFPKKDFIELGYEVEFFGEKTYNGVATLCSKKMSDIKKGFDLEDSVASKRHITVNVGNVQIINVYIPNGFCVGSEKYAYKLSWLETLEDYIARSLKNNDLIILLGDFNIAPEDLDIFDRTKVSDEIMFSPSERDALNRIRDLGLVDVFRQLHKDERAFSWWDYRMNAFKRNMGFRIDHIFASPKVAKSCKWIEIDVEARKALRPSDHAPVIAEFTL